MEVEEFEDIKSGYRIKFVSIYILCVGSEIRLIDSTIRFLKVTIDVLVKVK